jgi:subtilisin family serine protease
LAGIATSTRARARQLQAEQTAAQNQLQALGAEVTARFTRVANALRVQVAESELSRIAALPGVKRVERAPLYYRCRAKSVPFVGSPIVWSSALSPVDGRDIRIGIIDSGIDYTHADFGGVGNTAAFTDNDPSRIEPGTFPTAKIIGGFDFAGDDYNPADPARSTPKPDPDPLDCAASGHGTHVAGIVAGFGVLTNGLTYTGAYSRGLAFEEFAIGPGIAPRALLYALKVFGCDGPTDLVTEALEWAADPNGDYDFTDRLDVVNLSLGGGFGTLDPEATDIAAVNRLAALGCVVVCAAGNDENVFYAVSAPGVAERALSVANTIHQGKGQALEVLAPASIAGTYYCVEGAITPPLTNSEPVIGRVVYARPALGCGALDNPSALRGNIALIDRGTCFFSEKILHAQRAGAIAVIMVNNQDTAPIVMGGDGTGITIPGVMISQADGARIKARLTGTVRVRLDGTTTIERTEFVDTLDDGSSRGPSSPANLLKPDLSAPGIEIISAEAGSGSRGRSLSGTSMSSASVAGAAALLRQLHPSWTVADIKAALMNTAYPAADPVGTPYPESRMGAGRLQVDAAARAHVTVKADQAGGQVGLSFPTLAVAEPYRETRHVQLTNHGSTPATYQISIFNSVEQPGIALSSDETTVTVPAGGSVTMPFQLRADPAAFEFFPDLTTGSALGAGTLLPRHFLYEASGQIRFTNATETLHLPFYVNARGAVDFQALTPMLVLPPAQSTVRQPEVTIAFTDLPVAESLFPLVSAFQLGATSPNKRLSDRNRAAADLLAVGAATDIAYAGSLEESTVYFGLATASEWTTPQRKIAAFEVWIDLDNDDREEFVIYNDNASATNSAGGKDVFQSVVLELGPHFEILSTNATDFLNVYAADELDTAPFNNSVMVLSAPATWIGLAEESPSFHYRVVTHVSSGSVDQTGWIPFDAARPVIDTAFSSLDGVPIYDDGFPLTVRVNREAAATAGQRLPRVLLLHHFGLPGRRTEIVTLDLSHDDTDQDRLPDWWEEMIFASLDTAGLQTDFDEDGAPDRHEFQVGTDPTDSTSVFKMLSARRLASTSIAVRWLGVPGQVYSLERSTNLSSGFTHIVREGFHSISRTNTVTDTTAAGSGPFYYRVRLER